MRVHLMQRSLKDILRLLALRIRRIRLLLSARPSNDLSRKQQLLLEIGWIFRCSVFVETGTCFGDTVEIMRHHFDKVFSIELHEKLHELNKERFQGKGNVSLWLGDSGRLMSKVLQHVPTGRILFWLDAHYSGPGTAAEGRECPLLAELMAIAKHQRKDHCIVIDDVHMFGNQTDYPTREQVQQVLLNINPAFHVMIKNEIMVALPPETKPLQRLHQFM
jgi:hypothetical protein